ncbi:hypothetical protein DPMN_063805 [Dreissena polymorpha]|uniref:Uncharacterized protein n=1 Tax=Dreissena polymorpha TaxID=45954 RepID=A0A9D4CC27_DREPO|nr:hypothetical protein DPMN_063805 [Dreissena polymorpha]
MSYTDFVSCDDEDLNLKLTSRYTDYDEHCDSEFVQDITQSVVYEEIAPPPGGHDFKPTRTIYKLVRDTLFTKFHEDQTINVASREKCHAPGAHVFETTRTIFELAQDIIGTNLLTKFHDDRQ